MKKLFPCFILMMACGDVTGPQSVEPECVDHSRWVHTTDYRGCVDSVYVEITICYERSTYMLPSEVKGN